MTAGISPVGSSCGVRTPGCVLCLGAGAPGLLCPCRQPRVHEPVEDEGQRPVVLATWFLKEMFIAAMATVGANVAVYARKRCKSVRIWIAPVQFKSKPAIKTETGVPRETPVSERKKELTDRELSWLFRKPGKRNGVSFF